MSTPDERPRADLHDAIRVAWDAECRALELALLDEIKRLREERSRLRMALRGARSMMYDMGLEYSYSHLRDEIWSALAQDDEQEKDGEE